MNPYFIKFEKPKEELYLTISCLVKSEDKRLISSRDRIIKLLENKLSVINLDGENYKDYEKVVAKYKEDRLHFSLMNLLTYEINENFDFETLREGLEVNDFFIKAKEKGKEIMSKIKIKNEGEIKNIYFPQAIENSIAYNVYLNDEDTSFIKSFNYYRTGIKEIDNNSNKIKIHGDNFAINIVRFINNDNKDYYLKIDLYKEIEKINFDLRKKPIKVTFDLELVVSNPYLSNNNIFIK